MSKNNALHYAAFVEDAAATTGDDLSTHGHQNTLHLLVEGVHCAVCIQKIESSLNALNDVTEARLNFSNRRLTIQWQGEKERADDFAEHIESLGYGVKPYSAEREKMEHSDEGRFLLLCMGVAGFAMGNIMLLSVGIWTTSTETMGEATRHFMHWLSALIGIPTVLYSGRPFFRSAYAALKNAQTNMDVPISLALILATAVSLIKTIQHGEHVYFDSAVMLIFFLLVGRYFDFRARHRARSAATDLMKSLSSIAHYLPDGANGEEQAMRDIPLRDVRAGMMLRVHAGENIPVDGVIVKGESSVDMALVTGESMPEHKKADDEVYAGTVNLDGALVIEASGAIEKSLLADIVRLMEKAEQAQARYVRLADRIARLYTPVVHILALAAFLLWFGFLSAAWDQSLMIAVTVLIITCPCALGLAVPVVQVLASGRLMRRGLLLKSADTLERLAEIDTIFLDKTGTLTNGRAELIGAYDLDHLKLAASLASHTAHPLACALRDAARQLSGAETTLPLDQVSEEKGAGMSASYKGKKVKLGARSWCGDQDAAPHDGPELWLSINGKVQCAFRFRDVLREDAAQAIQALQALGFDAQKDIHILSGDAESSVAYIAQSLGLPQYHAGMKPDEKYQMLVEEMKQGRKVLMVGDGLNDAAVLTGAHVSIAPGNAIDMAQNTADMIFMERSFMSVPLAIQVARRAQSLVRQNIGIAFIYNIFAVPIAFMGFVTPMIAALAMSGSSILVVMNSFRLNKGEEKVQKET